MVFETHKNDIINMLKKNEDTEIVSKVLYNFGYLPDSIKYYLIAKNVVDECKDRINKIKNKRPNSEIYKFVNHLSTKFEVYKEYFEIEKGYNTELTYDKIYDLMEFIVKQDCADIIVNGIAKIIKFEFYVY